jgi:hypothetical protein
MNVWPTFCTDCAYLPFSCFFTMVLDLRRLVQCVFRSIQPIMLVGFYCYYTLPRMSKLLSLQHVFLPLADRCPLMTMPLDYGPCVLHIPPLYFVLYC